MKINLDDALPKAYAIGGKRLATLVSSLHEWDVEVPMMPQRAMKYRGIGRKMIGHLVKMGLVHNPIAHPELPLTFRAQRALDKALVGTKAEFVEAIRPGGKLDPFSINCVRNCGKLTVLELCKFFDVPFTARKRRPQFCPHCGRDIHEHPGIARLS